MAENLVWLYSDWRQTWMVYRFTEVGPPGGRIYLPVNRHYKPLGMSGVHVDYEKFLDRFVVFKKDPLKIAGNPWIKNGQNGLYLYNDDQCIVPDPFGDYGRRLGIALKHIRPFQTRYVREKQLREQKGT